MSWAGAIAVAGAVGLAAAGRGDDVTWTAPGTWATPPKPAVAIVPPKPKAAPADAAASVWRPAFAPAAATASEGPKWSAVAVAAPKPAAPTKPVAYELAVPIPVPASPIEVEQDPVPVPVPIPKPVDPPTPAEPAQKMPEPVAPTPPASAAPGKIAISSVPVPVSVYSASESQPLFHEAATMCDERFFAGAEYLHWWVRPGSIPVLATTAARPDFGFFGDPGTTALLGPGRLGRSQRDGLRVRAGGWLGDAGSLALEGSYFTLGRRTDGVSLSSVENLTIARPIFVANFGREYAELAAFPGLASGTLRVAQSNTLWGMEVNARRGVVADADRRADWFAGYRHMNLHDVLTIREDTVAGATAPEPVGTAMLTEERFETRNRFHGGQVGWTGGRRFGRVSVDARGGLALGVTRQEIDINGTQTRTRPGQPPEAFVGGLLAAGPNLGRFTRDKFAVIPEMGFNLGFDFVPGVRAFAGYNVFYWSNTVRPGDQIDRTVDLTFVPNAPPLASSGQNRPRVPWQQADFWAHGLQFGLDIRW